MLAEAAAIADALDAATVAPTPRANLRHAATAVLAAWDDQDNRDTDMITAMETPLYQPSQPLTDAHLRTPIDWMRSGSSVRNFQAFAQARTISS